MEELHYPPINYSHPLETAGPLRQLLGVAIDWALVWLGPAATYGIMSLPAIDNVGWDFFVYLGVATLVWLPSLAIVQLRQLASRYSTVGQLIVGLMVVTTESDLPAKLKRTALRKPLGWLIPTTVSVAWFALGVNLCSEKDNTAIFAVLFILTHGVSYGLVFGTSHRMLADRIAGTRTVYRP